MNTKYLLLALLLILNTICAQNKWEQIGPTGGDIQNIYTAGNGDLYIAARGSGLYRSTNNGDSWENLTKEFTPNIIPIAVSSLGYLYIGAQIGNLSSPIELLRSIDSGKSWDQLNIKDIQVIYDEKDGNILTNFYGYLLRVNEKTMQIDTLLKVNDGNVQAICKFNNTLLIGCSSGCYKSIDNGKTWQQKNNGLKCNVVGIDDIKSIICSSSGAFYALGSGVYLSEDLGENWASLNPGFSKEYIVIDSKENLYAIDGMGSNRYKAKIQMMLNSQPGIWYDINSDGLPFEAVFNLGIDKSDNLIAGLSKSGIYKYNTITNTWSESNEGLFGRTIWPLFVTPKGSLLAAEYPNHDLFRSTDKGNTWQKINIGDYFTFDFVSNSKGDLFLSAQIVGSSLTVIFKSTDDGVSWTELPFYNSAGFNGPLAINSRDYIFWGGYYLYRSMDNGISWERIYEINFMKDLFIDKNDHIYLGYGSDFTSDHQNLGIIKSEDDGNSWFAANDGLISKNVYYIIGDSKGYLFAYDNSSSDDKRGIFKSIDGGYTWNQVVSEYSLTGFAITSKDYIFASAGYDAAIYSADEGVNWKSLKEGLPSNLSGYSIATDKDNNVYLGTIGRSIFRMKDFVPTGIETEKNTLPKIFSLSQNYPNPFNPSTTIKYQIPASGHVTLKVYDVLGREVESLVNEFQTAGSYTRTLNASSLSSGVYFYRLQSGNYSATKKFVLMK